MPSQEGSPNVLAQKVRGARADHGSVRVMTLVPTEAPEMPEAIPAVDAQAITLREHLEARISAAESYLASMIREAEGKSEAQLISMQREMALIHKASDDAIRKAEMSQDKRLDEMNGMREQIREERAELATKDALDGVIKRVQMLEKFMWVLMGAFLILQVLARFIPQVVSAP